MLSSKKPCIALFLFTFSIGSFAQTGQIAIAHPVDNISVDGDLSDWPDDMVSYPIGGENGELWGDKPMDSTDFSATFKIGYNKKDKAIYIGVSVQDESFIIDKNENADFNTHDGNEIYLDIMHYPNGSPVIMRGVYGQTNTSFGYLPKIPEPLLKYREEGKNRYYEWKFLLGEYFDQYKSIGFDISVSDKDEDGSFSWLAWGKETGKMSSYNRLGDVFMLSEEVRFGKIEGTVGYDKSTKGKAKSVKIVSQENPNFWTQAIINDQGKYFCSLPQGKYIITPSSSVKSNFDESNPVIVEAKNKQTIKAKPLQVSMITPPSSLIGKEGVLKKEGMLNEEELEQFVTSYMKFYHIPGLSLAIVKDNKIIYTGAFGKKVAGFDDAVNKETLFEAASLTKPIFSYTVNRLAERGIIDLNKPLYEYFPYEPIAYDERYKLITARIVLSHRTGFPNWRSENEDRKLNINFTPGTAYRYSGEGFEYLKYVVQHITGKKIEEIIKEEVFTPLGIKNAQLTWTQDDNQSLIALPHTDGSTLRPKRIWRNPVVSSSLHINAENYCKFLLDLVNGAGLSEERHTDIFTIHSQPPANSSDSPMGLGVFIMETSDGLSYGHGGSNTGFTSNAVMYEKGKMGYVFLVNNQEAYPFDLALKAYLIEGNDGK